MRHIALQVLVKGLKQKQRSGCFGQLNNKFNNFSSWWRITVSDDGFRVMLAVSQSIVTRFDTALDVAVISPS